MCEKEGCFLNRVPPGGYSCLRTECGQSEGGAPRGGDWAVRLPGEGRLAQGRLVAPKVQDFVPVCPSLCPVLGMEKGAPAWVAPTSASSVSGTSVSAALPSGLPCGPWLNLTPGTSLGSPGNWRPHPCPVPHACPLPSVFGVFRDLLSTTIF